MLLVIFKMKLLFFQIWCAAGVDMSGGRTKDGGSIVGASVFYHEPPGKLVLFTFEQHFVYMMTNHFFFQYQQPQNLSRNQKMSWRL